jgi:hypothetical protein
MQKKFELPPTDLRCICDPKIFQFKDTSQVEPLDEVIGQQRAVQAIDFGLNKTLPRLNPWTKSSASKEPYRLSTLA